MSAVHRAFDVSEAQRRVLLDMLVEDELQMMGMLGNSGLFTAQGCTVNYNSSPHQDKGDSEWCIICWAPHGEPDFQSTFGMCPVECARGKQQLGVDFKPGPGDLLFINTQKLFHHTHTPAPV
jgi:hypothetical protein